MPNYHESNHGLEHLLYTLGKIWLEGVPLDWDKFYANQFRKFVPLPTYPFDLKAFWAKSNRDNQNGVSASKGRRRKMEEWFYVPSWKRSTPLIPNQIKKNKDLFWLVFLDETPFSLQVLKSIKRKQYNIYIVRPGETFEECSDNSFKINPKQIDSYELLVNSLKKRKVKPNAILHLWNLTQDSQVNIEDVQDLGFYSLLFLMKALENNNFTSQFKIITVSNFLHQVYWK